jgi:hypothetical protein
MCQQQTAAAGATEQRSTKRKLTKEELAAISRANGARSRGATSPEGAARARRGNYKHGLRCEVLPLQTEDSGAIAQTVHNWFDYYRPNSPIAHTIVKMCAQSDIMLDRCYTFLGTALDGQGKEVFEAWHDSRNGIVAEAVALLPLEPIRAISILRNTSHGCRWLLEEWSQCQDGLRRYGYWPLELWPDIVRLVGADTDLDRIGASEEAFSLALFNFQCQPRPAVEQIAALCLPARRPAALAHLRLPEALPGPEECRQRLRGMVAATIEGLRSLEAELRMGKERAELEFVLKKCLMLGDCDSSRQFLRYHKEWSSLFFRASRVLPLTLQQDASGFFDDLAAPDDDEPLQTQPRSPWERVPEGRVRADATPDAVASEAAAGPARADAPPDATEPGSHSPSDSNPAPAKAAMATPAAAVVAHPAVVAEEPRADDAPGGALPAPAGLAVTEAEGATDRVGFPDPPSSALPASAGLAVEKAAGATNRAGFPDPPSSAPAEMTQSIYGSKIKLHDPALMPRGHGDAVRSIRDGPQAPPPPTDREPPVGPGAPRSK